MVKFKEPIPSLTIVLGRIDAQDCDCEFLVATLSCAMTHILIPNVPTHDALMQRLPFLLQ